MRVFDELLQSVIFVGVEAFGTFTPLGTAFLAGINAVGHSFPILITANHVVDQIAGDNIFLRMNRRGGAGAEVISYPKSRRLLHPDSANDIAIFPAQAWFESYEVLMWNLDKVREEQVRAGTWKPAPGDEVQTVGLYTSHYGIARNLPVVRVGHIAMVPGEPVRTDHGYVQAYLVETKSIAGLSGSPVHLQVPRIRFTEDNLMQTLDQDISILLGVMIGYHVVESAEDQISVPQFQSSEFKSTSGMTSEQNTGFAVVVPIERVFDIMETDDVKNQLSVAAAIHLKRSGFRRASAAPPKATPAAPDDANPDHREDFTALLGAAAKVRSPKDRT